MSFSDETLMAYADGELAEPALSEVERAVRSDPAVAARVAQHQVLRADVFAAFAPVADEPVPPRLVAAALPGKVADLNAVRAARAGGAHHAAASTSHAPEHGARRRWSWQEWGGVAASLAVGVLVGSVVSGGAAPERKGQAAIAVAGADGALVARGPLAHALSQQLAGAAGGEVDIGVSFAAKDGALCRSFTMRQSAGLACRSGEQWKLVMMAEAGKGEAGEYRQAGSAMPSAVLEAIDARIAGTTFDAQAELAAKLRDWKR
jgi:anti-sigma factor RsiW